MDVSRIRSEAAHRDWASTVDGGPLRMAVVGMGWFGEDVGLTAIAGSDDCEATVAVSGSAEKAERVAAEHDLEHGLTYEEFHEGVGTDAYDAVYVTTPNALHLPHIEAAAELDKHVICEKPLEASVDRARAAVQACEDAGVTLMVAYRMQTTPEIRRLREMLADGVIGDPVHAEGSFTFRINPGPDTWRVNRDLAGGAALYDVGVYPINTLRFVLGEEPSQLRGHMVSQSAGFEDVDDEHVTAQLEFPSGATAACHASFNAFSENRLRIVGTSGRVEIDPVFNVQVDRELRVETDDGVFTISTGVDEIVEEFDYFASVILGETSLEPSGQDGLRDMEILAAIEDSSRHGGCRNPRTP